MSNITVEKFDFEGKTRQQIEIILSERATEMALEHWGIRIVGGIDVIVNARLTRTLGRMSHYSKRNKWVEMGKNFIKYGAPVVIEDVLLHEVTHWILLHSGLPFSDGHPYFENELRRVGAKSTGSYNVGLYQVYNCDCEEKEHLSSRKMSGYQCTSCEVSLKYSHAKAFDGQGVEKILEEVQI